MLTEGSYQQSAPTVGSQCWEIVLRADIGNVDRTMLTYPANPWVIDTDRDMASGYGTKWRSRNHSVPLAESQPQVIDPANPRCALDDSIKHRLNVCGRTANNTEHLGGCCLMFQGLAQF